MVKDKNFRLILGYMILVLFIGLSGGTLNGRNASYSLQEDESFRYFRSFSFISDEHLSPGEKVYIKMDADVDKIKSIELQLLNSKHNKRFFVDVESLKKKPYFVLPDFNKNIVSGYKYDLDIVKVVFDSGKTVSYSTHDYTGLYVYLDQVNNSSVTLEKKREDSVWRDFVNVSIPDNTISILYENTYVDLNADVKDIVNVELEFENEDKTESFVTYLNNLETRPFFIINDSDAVSGDKYNLKYIDVFYKDGNHVTYSTTKNDNAPYVSIGSNRSILVAQNLIDADSSRYIEADTEKANNITDVEVIDDDYNTTFAGVIVLVLVLLIAVGIFVFLKDEDR